MIPPLLFASANKDKAREVRAFLSDFDLTFPQIDLDAQELGDTYEQNSLLKAKAYHKAFPDYAVFADDTGLEIDALGNQPGVHSKRYDKTNDLRISKVLNNLKNKPDRSAKFVCDICLIYQSKITHFNAQIKGKIAPAPLGSRGFGYDSIFIPNGFDQTFSQLKAQTKNQISHRALALKQLKEYLLSLES